MLSVVRDILGRVRASRLNSILLLLQARCRSMAVALAVELEVLVRTIYRDIEAPYQAGVALYGEAGRNGGYRLVDGHRTQLTGLTRDGAGAPPLAGLLTAAGDLGLGSPAAGAAGQARRRPKRGPAPPGRRGTPPAAPPPNEDRAAARSALAVYRGDPELRRV
jgi:predicted DNA-binding transcriptional regulator YafY